jgi:ArsR family transcriptional regulator
MQRCGLPAPGVAAGSLNRADESMDRADDDAAAERLKALGHPVRLAILRALAEQSCCCCADVCSRLPLAQSTVSQHLKVLKEAGLVTFRREGVRSSYVLNPDALAALRSDLAEVTDLLVAVSGPAAQREAR